VTALEYTNHVLRYTAVLAGDHDVTLQRTSAFQTSMQDACCNGAQKPFFLAGVSEEVTFHWNTFDEGPRTAVISINPAQCSGVASVPVESADPIARVQSPTAGLDAQPQAQPIQVPTADTPLVAQPLSEDEQRHALAGNQQCIDGNVVEYTCQTHPFAKLGPPDVHCKERMADDPLR
jgi:hypothetical protein